MSCFPEVMSYDRIPELRNAIKDARGGYLDHYPRWVQEDCVKAYEQIAKRWAQWRPFYAKLVRAGLATLKNYKAPDEIPALSSCSLNIRAIYAMVSQRLQELPDEMILHLRIPAKTPKGYR